MEFSTILCSRSPSTIASAVADEIEQKIEDLGLERDERLHPPQFAAFGIEHEILEMNCQSALGSRPEIKVLSA